jgi:hypothetical protein
MAEKRAKISFNKYETYCFTFKTLPFLLPYALSRFCIGFHIFSEREMFSHKLTLTFNTGLVLSRFYYNGKS